MPNYLFIIGNGKAETVDAYLYCDTKQYGRMLTFQGEGGFATVVVLPTQQSAEYQADRLRSGLFGVVVCDHAVEAVSRFYKAVDGSKRPGVIRTEATQHEVEV